VLVDAPCSGTGTWRRNPDAKWRLTSADIEELVALQRRILSSAARLVKPGGRLVYATCSFLKRENQAQIDWFLGQDSTFALLPVEAIWREVIGGEAPCPGPYLSLSPLHHETNGFFLAVLERQRKAEVEADLEGDDVDDPPSTIPPPGGGRNGSVGKCAA
jgi:16S rRNA (cytosine967-C5)-methyltransferase